jgi:FixJ family two-component response regulator
MTVGNRNILIIGVDPDICTAPLTALLESNEYTVHQVETGKEGMSALQQQTFGAVFLLESLLPDINGREFLDILVKSHPLLSIIILTVGSKDGSKKGNEFFKRGAFCLVEMPSWDQGLLLAVSEAIRPRTQCFNRPYLEEISPRVHAELMIRHSVQLYAKFKKWKFKFLAETAREWLRLIEAGSVSEPDVAALVARVTHGRWSGPRWFGVAHYISRWACSLGFPGVDFNAIKNSLPEEPKENGH